MSLARAVQPARILFAMPEYSAESTSRSSAFEAAWSLYCAQASTAPGRTGANKRSAASGIHLEEAMDSAAAQLTQVVMDSNQRLTESVDKLTTAVARAQADTRNQGGSFRGQTPDAGGAPIAGATQLKMEQQREGQRLNLLRPASRADIDYDAEMPALDRFGKPQSWPNVHNAFYGSSKWDAIPHKPAGALPPYHFYNPSWRLYFYEAGKSIIDARSDSHFLNRMGDLPRAVATTRGGAS